MPAQVVGRIDATRSPNRASRNRVRTRCKVPYPPSPNRVTLGTGDGHDSAMLAIDHQAKGHTVHKDVFRPVEQSH